MQRNDDKLSLCQVMVKKLENEKFMGIEYRGIVC